MTSPYETRSKKVKSGISVVEESCAPALSGAPRLARALSEPDDTSFVVKNFANADKIFNVTELITAFRNNLGTAKAMKVFLQPGANWEKCSKHPISSEEADALPSNCQARHVGFVDQGKLAIETGDGESIISEGEAYVLLPGHKTKVLGLIPVVLYEFDSVMDKVVVPRHQTQQESDFDGVLATSEEPVVSHKSFESLPLQSSSKDNFATFSTLEFESARIKKTAAKPGYSWKEHVRPGLEGHESGDTSCIDRHVGFLKSGQLQITMDDDGKQRTLVPGDSFVIEAGHQAEVPSGSDDMMVMYEFITGL